MFNFEYYMSRNNLEYYHVVGKELKWQVITEYNANVIVYDTESGDIELQGENMNDHIDDLMISQFEQFINNKEGNGYV